MSAQLGLARVRDDSAMSHLMSAQRGKSTWRVISALDCQLTSALLHVVDLTRSQARKNDVRQDRHEDDKDLLLFARLPRHAKVSSSVCVQPSVTIFSRSVDVRKRFL